LQPKPYPFSISRVLSWNHGWMIYILIWLAFCSNYPFYLWEAGSACTAQRNPPKCLIIKSMEMFLWPLENKQFNQKIWCP
jgi:hypothetical protein